MRDPTTYTRSLLACQCTMTAIYLSIGTVIYYYCGSYVSSPALGSAGTLIKKVSYGIALPGLIVSTVIVLHVSDVIRALASSSCSVLTARSSQANTSSFASYEAPSTSLPTPSNIGPLGSDAPSSSPHPPT